MATGSGAFGVKGGFNQSAGAYYLVISSVAEQVLTYTPGTGSGGATTQGSFANMTGVGTAYDAGVLIKDMGRTVISSGRTFRKFQAVLNTNAAYASSLGVGGVAASGANPGYLTAYLELGRDGSFAGQQEGIPKIARFA